jgi:uncharacterized SAM-dependent methyltransferase
MGKGKDVIKINDLIFKELIKRGYSLEGNTRVWNVADSKLWYLTPEQAQSYLDLIDSEEYQDGIGSKEFNLIKKSMTDLTLPVGKTPVNIIDLGCGNGKKALLFIQNLNKKSKLRYCPIDISGYMVDRAIQNMKTVGVGDIVKFQWNISDFENLENITPLLTRGEYKKNYFLLLGNTLGNFEIHEILYEIRSGMKDDDLLLIGNGLNNHQLEQDLIKQSQNDEKIKNFLVHMPLKIGLKMSEIEYGVRFRDPRVEFYYTIKNDKTVTFQDKKVQFNKGDQIIVAVTYHYEKENFLGYLKMYFGSVKIFTSEDGSYALALCKK